MSQHTNEHKLGVLDEIKEDGTLRSHLPWAYYEEQGLGLPERTVGSRLVTCSLRGCRRWRSEWWTMPGQVRTTPEVAERQAVPF